MLVKDLIELLQGQDKDAKIVMGSPKHDYWNNVEAKDINNVAEAVVGYNGCEEIILSDDLEVDDYESTRPVLVLS